MYTTHCAICELLELFDAGLYRWTIGILLPTIFGFVEVQVCWKVEGVGMIFPNGDANCETFLLHTCPQSFHFAINTFQDVQTWTPNILNVFLLQYFEGNVHRRKKLFLPHDSCRLCSVLSPQPAWDQDRCRRRLFFALSTFLLSLCINLLHFASICYTSHFTFIYACPKCMML